MSSLPTSNSWTGCGDVLAVKDLGDLRNFASSIMHFRACDENDQSRLKPNPISEQFGSGTVPLVGPLYVVYSQC